MNFLDAVKELKSGNCEAIRELRLNDNSYFKESINGELVLYMNKKDDFLPCIDWKPSLSDYLSEWEIIYSIKEYVRVVEPCPFCSSKDVKIKNLIDGLFCYKCNGCGVYGPSFVSKEKALEKWNERK